MSLWAELKRRNVVRVAIAYVVTSWVVIEVSSLILDIFGASENVSKIIVALLALGLPVALVFAWAFEVTPEGIKRDADADHDSGAAHHQAKRLDLLTIGMVVLAIALLAADRFIGRPDAPPPPVEAAQTEADTPTPPQPDGETPPAEGEPVHDAAWAAQQLLEIQRISDLGLEQEAFDLARSVAEVLPEINDQDALWDSFSWSNRIDSVPSGAEVWRQRNDDPDGEWELLGTTPLEKERFVVWVGSRIRFDLEGHYSLTMRQEALMGPDMPYGFNANNPAILVPVDEAPGDMVRLPGFTADLVEYGAYYMDRFEVTNRQFEAFVAAGGYSTPAYWTEPFLRDGEEIPFDTAVTEFVDRTGRPGPATWEGGSWPDGEGNYPVNGISWYEAAAYANFAGKMLPTQQHHQQALRLYNINSGIISQSSNFGTGGPREVGQDRAMTTFGLYDHVGNVREWCWNAMRENDRCSFGTSWADIPYMADSASPKSPWDRSPEHGVRLAQSMDAPDKLARLRQPVEATLIRDFSQETPAGDVEYKILKRFYTYDAGPLNAEVVNSAERERWREDRVEFDLPSGERGAAYLLVPNNRPPPYPTVLFWPGSDMINRRHIDEANYDYMDFMVKSGYMVAWPVFWGTLDRDDPDNPITQSNQWGSHDTPANTYYRDLQVTWVQEMSRTIDYLETRPDLFNGQLGFYGVSWGGFRGPIGLAVESNRIDAAVLAVAGLNADVEYLPETDTFNFAPRVTMPVLMINGEFDAVAPRATEGQPLYDALGTDPEHKKMYLAPTSHFMPREVLIRETLDWFDRYLDEGG